MKIEEDLPSVFFIIVCTSDLQFASVGEKHKSGVAISFSGVTVTFI